MLRRHLYCDPNRLRLLLQDGLPKEQQAEVVDHLDGCAQCQEALEGLAADKSWWVHLRQLHESEAPRERHRGISAAELGEDFPAGFLTPAEDPAHLGRLGPFAVTAVVGRGGMGVVLKAWDAALNRLVAIKILAPQFASNGSARKRFAREAQAAAAVVHEHVVPIHGVDSWKGLPYLVMAYIAGRSLQERLDQDGPLGVKEILRIGMQAASGLAAAHAQGLVHRDVKPANILLENGVERVRLTDFGLARAVDDASVTQSGVVAGTPQYMAPEQASGGPVDHRADLFSLGSTLYAMCTGHAPFRADSAMAVLRRVCDEQPRPIREINPDIPEWLLVIIAKLHAKEPCERFQTAAEVAELLGRCLAHLQQPNTILLPTIVTAVAVRGKAWRPNRSVTAAAILLAFIFGTWATLHWAPSGGFAPSTALETAQVPSMPPVTAREEDSLQELRRQTAALEADLKQSRVPGVVDPADAFLRQAQQRLYELERELNMTAPENRQAVIPRP
jgi:serine/threonine protein kinase